MARITILDIDPRQEKEDLKKLRAQIAKAARAMQAISRKHNRALDASLDMWSDDEWDDDERLMVYEDAYLPDFSDLEPEPLDFDPIKYALRFRKMARDREKR